MKLPFTVEQFFDTFARYNLSVWPMQIILTGLAIAIVILLFSARQFNHRLISAVLSFFWAWMAIAYHFTFFTAINPAAWFFGGFFLAGALWFAWVGVLKNKLQFSLHGGIRAWWFADSVFSYHLPVTWISFRSSLSRNAYLWFAVSHDDFHTWYIVIFGVPIPTVCVHCTRAMERDRLFCCFSAQCPSRLWATNRRVDRIGCCYFARTDANKPLTGCIVPAIGLGLMVC
jgi:hypothetical protein